MTRSRQLAGIVGPALVAITASEALNLRIWAGVPAALVYLNGALLFVAGLSIVRTHNLWTLRWPVLLTLTGWAALAAGLYRLFAPEAPQAPDGPATYAVITLLGLTGLVLTFKAYAGGDREGGGEPRSGVGLD